MIDSKLTLEGNLLSAASGASQKLGLLRKAYSMFGDRVVSVTHRFPYFLLLLLEFCPLVWCSAVDIHLCLLVRVAVNVSFLCVAVMVILLILHGSEEGNVLQKYPRRQALTTFVAAQCFHTSSDCSVFRCTLFCVVLRIVALFSIHAVFCQRQRLCSTLAVLWYSSCRLEWFTILV